MEKKSLNHAEFWLPPQFPNEFPYEFETTFASSTNSTLDSPVESVISSNETQTSDEDDFFAALTQRLSQNLTYNKSEKKVVISGSPQSTLSGFGSPTQAPSPPTTPFGVENNTWDLIYAAAGQLARLKINGDGVMGLPQNSNLFPSFQNPTLGFYSQSSQFQYGTRSVQNQQIQRRERDFTQSAWPTLQTHRRCESPAVQPGPVFHGGGSAPRKECVGTGVFLPRRYDNPPQSCKKSDSRPVSTIQGKVFHGRNPSMEGLTRSAPQTTSNHRVAPSHEALIAKRNAIFSQQRLNHHRSTDGVKSHELLLPQEWTY